jgi:hypothetical protein
MVQGKTKGTATYARNSVARRQVQSRGLAALDKRTVVARQLFAWRRQLIADLGGERELSAQRMALVDLASRTRAHLEIVDAYLAGLPSLIDPATKSLVPALRERQTLEASLVRILMAVGLDRRRVQLPTLEEARAQAERVDG